MNLRTLGKNACFYSAGTIGARTASFLLIPVYTHTLSTGDYGLLSVLLQTAQIMVIVIGIGSRTAFVRFAKEYENQGRTGLLLGTSVAINLLGALAVTAIALLASPLFKGVLHSERVLGYVLLTSAGAFFNCLSVHLLSYYRAGHEGLKVTLASLASAVSLIVLSLVLLRVFHLGIQGALLAQAIIYGALAAFLLAMICTKIRLGFSLPLMLHLVRFGLPLILVSAGGLATQASAMYSVSYFNGLEDAGIFSLGMKMAQAAEMVLILPFEMAYEPFVYGHAGGGALWAAVSRILTYLMTAFVFVACGVMFAARALLPVIAPPAFRPAYFVILLALPAVAFRGVYYIGESLLYLEKKTDLVGSVVVAFTVLGVALNYLLVWRWGLYGAVAVYIITTVGAGVTVMRLALKRTVVRVEWGRLFVAATLLLGFMAAVYALRGAAGYAYYSLVPASVCAATLLLYSTSFIREDEKRMIRALITRIAVFT